MPLLSGSLTELVVLTHLLVPVPFLMRFSVMIFLLEALIELQSTTLLQSKCTFSLDIKCSTSYTCAILYNFIHVINKQ